MSIKHFFGIFVTYTTLLTSAIITAQPSKAQSITFRCQVDNNQIPTTYAVTPDGAKPVIKWQSKFFTNHPPMSRCNEVTKRFNNFNSKNMMQDITSGWVNRYPVVCVTFNCNEDTVLFTLRPDQDPNQVLQEIFANRQGASTPTFQCSGCAPSYNLQEYLDRTPIEKVGNSRNIAPSSSPTPSMPKPATSNVTW